MHDFNVNKLILDKADSAIRGTFYAKSDDVNGRRLQVQITDNGLVIDTTGYTMALGFRTSKGTTGLASFDIVDVTKGLYEIYYPTSMMIPGTVKAEIKIYNLAKLVSSKTFNVVVEKSVVDEDTVVATNDFSLLQEALVQVSSWDSQFEQKYDGLEAEYATDLTQVKTQLAHTESALHKRVDNLVIPISAENANLEVTDAHVSVAKNKEFDSIAQRFEEIEDDSFFPITNKFENADFSKLDLSGRPYDWSYSHSTINVSNGSLLNTGIGTSEQASISQPVQFHTGHKYFGKASVRVKNEAVSLIFKIAGGNGHLIVTNPTPNEWYTVGKMFEVPQGGIFPNSFSHSYSTPEESVGKNMEFKKPLLVDLTEAFGYGNEPTEDEFNKILSYYPDGWFNGTTNIADDKKILNFLLKEVRNFNSETGMEDKADKTYVDTNFAKKTYVDETFAKKTDVNNGGVARGFVAQETPKDLQAQILFNSESSILHDFQTDIENVYGSIGYDTQEKYSGLRSLKMSVTPSLTYSTGRVTLDGDGIDLSNGYLTLMGMQPSDATQLLNIRLQMYGAGMVDLGHWNRAGGGPLIISKNKWELITFTNTNPTALTQNVKYIDITISSSGASEIYLNQLRRVQSPNEKYVTITLDGAYKTQYTELKPLLDAKGYRAVMMVSTPSLIGTGSYMTWEELRECQNSGWDISFHSGVRVDQMTEVELRELAVDRQRSHVENGFELKRGGRFWCSLQNQWNELAVNTLSEYFYFLRTGAGPVLYNTPQHTSLPIFNPKNIPDIASNATYDQQINLLDNAMTHNSWAVFTWHQPNREGELSYQQMSDILDRIENQGGKVVTFSDVYDRILRLPSI